MNLPFSLNFSLLPENALLRSLLLIFSYIILAKAIDLFINKILKGLAQKSNWQMDDQIINVIHGPVYWTVFHLGILHVLTIQPLAEPWQHLAVTIAKSLIVLVWILAVYKSLSFLVTREHIQLLIRNQISNDAANIIRKLARLSLFILAGILCLRLWKIDLTPILASAGIAGIAVAMAAKDTLANFFGGMSIFMDNTFKEGDYIVLDSGERGEVVDIGMRSSRIKTRDDIMITIPNSILANTKIINESAPFPRYRIRIPFGVAYGSSPQQVEDVLVPLAVQHDQVSNEPEPRVRFRQFGASSLDFELLCWVEDPSLKGLVTHLLLKEIYTTLNREKIAIPFPQMDVHLKRANDAL